MNLLGSTGVIAGAKGRIMESQEDQDIARALLGSSDARIAEAALRVFSTTGASKNVAAVGLQALSEAAVGTVGVTQKASTSRNADEGRSRSRDRSRPTTRRLQHKHTAGNFDRVESLADSKSNAKSSEKSSTTDRLQRR